MFNVAEFSWYALSKALRLHGAANVCTFNIISLRDRLRPFLSNRSSRPIKTMPTEYTGFSLQARYQMTVSSNQSLIKVERVKHKIGISRRLLTIYIRLYHHIMSP